MNRGIKVLCALLTAAVLCFGSYEVASAVASRSGGVASTEPITACSTSAGDLRLLGSDGHCPSGTTKVELARPATAPLTVSMNFPAGETHRKSLSLVAGTKLTAKCGRYENQAGSFDGSLTVIRSGKTQIDGTSFVGASDGAGVYFQFSNGEQVGTGGGAQSVYSTTPGGFHAYVGESSAYATVNMHLLVTVPGAVFTIDGLVDVNTSNNYCRVTAEVESTTT